MKRLVTFFAVLLLVVTAWAQNPKLTYQAVVRDNANMLLTNGTVDVTISVLRTDNSLQYTQSFDNVPTNQNGLFTLFFGGESGWDNVNWIHSKIAVAITLPDHSVVKDTTDVNAVPLAISTINAGTTGPSTQVQSDWAQTDQTAPSFIQNKPDIGESLNTVLVNGQYVTITMMDGRHYLTSDSTVIVNMRNNISNNTTNIAANTTNISNNTANIETNTANIATNTTNIAANTTNIETNTTNISNNTANIETNTTNISSNTAHIATNTTNINNLILHTQKVAIRDSVAGQIHDSIAAIGATITQNHTHTNMSVLSATTAPFTTANKATLDSLAGAGAEQNVQADWNETNAANDAFIRNKPVITDTVNNILTNRNFVTNTMMDGRHYLTSDSIVIVNMQGSISNNTTLINNNTTNIAANTTLINNNTTNISNNTTNISNNTTNIAANTTNIATNTTNISNNTTNIAANTTNINNNTTNIATNTTNINNNTTKINNNTANIATNTTNISNNTAHIATNTTNINNLILHTKKAAIRDSVAGQIHDSIAANNLVTINNNQTISGDKTFTGTNDFTQGTTTVASGFTIGTTTIANCNNVAVNACDLLAVFDSIQRRMDNMEAVIADLQDEVSNLRDSLKIIRGDSVPTVTVTLPTVSTSSVTGITETTATCGGNVTADGGADVTARGVCWSTGANPTIGGSHSTDGAGTGSFTSTITGLTAGTIYHVRAYATNSEGTAYGEEVSFTTQNTTPVTPVDGQSCPGMATVTDHQGNVYNTVQIGSQCWTKENMRCTTSPSTGTTILEATPSSFSYTGKKAYYVDGSSSNTSTYGLLYNWNAAVDTFNTSYGETSTNTSSSNAVNVTFSGKRRGICPQGWHVPSDAEWTQLTTYVKSQPEYVCSGCIQTFDEWGEFLDDEWITYCIAKALSSTTGWNTYTGTFSGKDCYPGYSPSLNNATGFSAVPAGHYSGEYDHFGIFANFWSATQINSDYAYCYYWGNDYDLVQKARTQTFPGYSVRCLRDEAGGSTASLPTVTTSSATNITETTAICGGNVTADGGADVAARGVCWSTNANPTIDGSHTTDGSGTGSFTSTITGLTANTTYHVRAYATNSEGTAYGEEVSFTTQNTTPVTPVDGQPCPGTPTVKDYDNNTYNTVQIGNQCWMKQNLKTTHYSDGTSISLGSSTSETTAYRYNPDGNSSNVSTYGYLYNWKAVMRSSSSSSNNPSGVQGICPTGWHVPSDAEWTQLTTYVKSQPEYVCEGCSGTDNEWSTYCIAKALASTTGWNTYAGTSSDRDCYPGYSPSSNNATGFSAVPAGYYYGSYSYFGYYAYFWSSTQYDSYSAYSRGLCYYDTGVSRYYGSKYYGFSVRCLRD